MTLKENIIKENIVQEESLHNLCSAIQKETSIQVDSILKLAQEKVTENIKKAEAEAAQIEKKLTSQAINKAEEIKKRGLSNVNTENKKIFLKIQEEIIQEVQTKIKNKINCVRENQELYSELLKKLTMEALLLFSEPKVELIINKKDSKIVTNSFLKEIEEFLSKKKQKTKIKLAEENHTETGIILKASDKAVIWSNTLEERMKSFSQEIQEIIVKEIFK